MEWVETTGKSVEEAKELALDQLGVDSKDAEFEVVEEPRVGLFGRTRGVARVRARVVPKAPRPKTERRRRQRRSDRGGEGSERASKGSSSKRGGGQKDQKDQKDTDGAAKAERPKKDRKEAAAAPATTSDAKQQQEKQERKPMEMDEQIEVVTGFLERLGSAFGLDVRVEATEVDGDLAVNLVGDGLGVLVGPRLATLDAIQEIVRHVLQRQAEGREYARVIVDVQGIRARRREALREYVTDAAARVRDEGVTVVFEVMSSPDRKFVHDVVNELEGVASASEGEDPRRRVVLRPA